MSKLFLSIGSICAALAVILGAFGAHALKSNLAADMLEIFETGVQYHFYHALGLLAVGFLAIHYPESGYLKWSGWLMLAGIIIFSGSLYILSISGVRWLGAITPIGGVSFIAAWLLLSIAILSAN
ncbi:DUF423 domain-containing protein [Aliifodinibius sp. S!AR15-10]|uniref:DUF423 domain-containing protein n=1 Tax=Aliifodinibius sp. S!AR15-10 TaxID=2950437 RepID=UPI00285C4C3E|nr:DUF423 domain-containing protein [Aliifodinibius sp. S!AR15-10]MDR8392486.1 DUF423 domain-containing protein [Aliifodinibius sp. S!AR15-10]